MYNSLDAALIRIAELEAENADLKAKLAVYEARKPAGRPVHDEAWQNSYNDFVVLYESGMPMVEIVEKSDFSRRTAYRYKKYYDEISGMENKKCQI